MRIFNKPAYGIAGAILAISACSASQTPSARKAKNGMASTESSSPWQLRLETAGALGLRLSLRNHSQSMQTYLYDSRLQPAELHLIDSGGRQITGADRREVMKFDATIHRSHYKTMKAGSEAPLSEASFARSNGHYELRWGIFVFNGLTPGKYRVQAVWKSEESQWHERDSNKSGVISGIWLGTVSSNTMEITLP